MSSLAVTALALFALCAVLALAALARHNARVHAAETHLAQAAAREFEGAKPALIHACDAAVDALPDGLDLTALEAKALITLTWLLKRLLVANPILGGAGLMLIGLLPMAFSALPKSVDVSSYKGLLKEEVAKLIVEARL